VAVTGGKGRFEPCPDGGIFVGDGKRGFHIELGKARPEGERQARKIAEKGSFYSSARRKDFKLVRGKKGESRKAVFKKRRGKKGRNRSTGKRGKLLKRLLLRGSGGGG